MTGRTNNEMADMDMHTAELDFARALADATSDNLIHWEVVTDDDRDITRAKIDGGTVEIEFMCFPVTLGATSEKLLATVSGMDTYFQVAAGTETYQVLRRMLSHTRSWESGIEKLQKATARLRALPKPQ